MTTKDPNTLALRLEFAPGISDLDKAIAGFDATIQFRDLIDAITDEVGATGKVEWVHRATFDGDDAGAQPTYDALVKAYEKGRAAGAQP